MRSSWWVVVIGLVLGTGCVLDEVDLTGKACPCADGWRCDEATDRCVRDGEDAGSAGMDAGPSPEDGGPSPEDGGPSPDDAGPAPDGGPGEPDAGPGPLDAGPVDAGLRDAGPGPVDSGPTDGGPAPVDAGTDAGVPDAGAEAGTDAGPDETVCDELSGTIFCDGFELGFIPWDFRTETSGTTTIVSSPVYRGTQALQSDTTAASGKASVEAEYATVTTGSLFARAYFYLPSTLDSEGISFFFLGEDVPPYFGVAMQLLASERVEVYLGTEDVLIDSTPRAFPRDRWVCAQMRVDLHETNGTVQAWLDGMIVASQTGLDTIPDGGYGQIVVGVEWSSPAQTSSRLYVDEVVLSTVPVPCD